VPKAWKTKKIKSPIWNIGAIHNELLDLCPVYMREAVTQLFIYKHADWLNTYKVPWFAPTWLGGWGLRGDLSSEQRHTASAICKRWLFCRPFKVSAIAEWYMHKFVMDKLNSQVHMDCAYREIRFGDVYVDAEKSWKDAYQYLIMETLFTKTAEQLKTVCKYSDIAIHRKMRHNERIWDICNEIKWSITKKIMTPSELEQETIKVVPAVSIR